MKTNLQEITYFGFFGILLIAKGIGLYEGMPLFNVCLVLAVFFLGCKFLLTDYTPGEWGMIFLFTLISFLAYRTTGEKAVIITILNVMGMKNIPVKRLLRFAFVINSVLGSCFVIVWDFRILMSFIFHILSGWHSFYICFR